MWLNPVWAWVTSSCIWIWFNLAWQRSDPVTNMFADESVIALANGCPLLRSLGLYYCQNITDRAMYSLAQSRVRNKHGVWHSIKSRNEDNGLVNLNISQCTALTPSAVQAVCDSSPALHTCPGRHSLIKSGCLNLTSVRCACGIHSHRTASTTAHWERFVQSLDDQYRYPLVNTAVSICYVIKSCRNYFCIVVF